MKELSDVVLNAPKSKIRKLFDLATGKSDIISLGIGQPDFPTFKPLVEGSINALKAQKTKYPPTRGLPELRKLISDVMKRENNIVSNWEDNVLVTSGGSQAISLALAVILNPNDNVILSSPNFISYYYLIQFLYAKTIESPRNNDLSPNFDELRKKINQKTKLIIVNSPNNPTGYVYTKKEWEELAEIVLENDLYLLSDECYHKYVYDSNSHISPASLNGMENRTITLNSISKTFSATGLRLGYIIANPEIITLMEKYHQYTTAGVNHPTQYGTIDALKSPDLNFEKILSSFTERRNLSFDRLKKMGIEVTKPGGAFYIMPSVKKFGLSSDEFSMRLIKEKGVAVVPGDIFGSFSDDRIRISYATDIEKLKLAYDRIEEFISTL